MNFNRPYVGKMIIILGHAEGQQNYHFGNIYISSYGGAANIKFEEQVQIHKTIPQGTP